MNGTKVAHITTVDISLQFLLSDQLRFLRDAGFEVTGISAPGPWTRRLEQDGIRHVAWTNISRAWDPFADFKAFLELISILRADDFALVHTHTPKAGILGRLAARVAGVPHIVNTVHGYYATPDDALIKRAAVLVPEWIAGRVSDTELFQNMADLAWADHLHVGPKDRRLYIGNGIDLDRFDPARVDPARVRALREELGIEETALVVGTVGRLAREKGWDELVTAAEKVRARVPGVHFLAVGAHEDPATPASEHVTVTGWRDDIAELLTLMEVFVLPSWREGLPRSAMEASAMAKPMVLTDVRGNREVARDGVEAVFVPAQDAPRLADAIAQLLSNPEQRRALGDASRKRALSEFDQRLVFERVLRAYRDLLRTEEKITRPGGVILRPAQRGDAPATSHLHATGLPDAFLTSLGAAFLQQLYTSLIADPAAVVMVAEQSGRVLGFVAGTTNVAGSYRRFIFRRGIFGLAAAVSQMFSKDTRRRALETYRYPETQRTDEAEILAVAVDEELRGEGIGLALVQETTARLKAKGAGSIRVVTASDNTAANRLYASAGFQDAGFIRVHADRESRLWNLPSCS